jgi:hypothetical protein
MQSSLKQSITFSKMPHNWEKQESVYTGDNLIDAYLIGKEDGKNQMITILTNQFKKNIDIATSTAEKLYSEALKKKINFKSIHLRADSITKFSALFITEKSDFVSNKFRNIFISARKLKDEVESESFYITFSFMPNTKDLSEKCLSSDGFFLKYDKK